MHVLFCSLVFFWCTHRSVISSTSHSSENWVPTRYLLTIWASTPKTYINETLLSVWAQKFQIKFMIFLFLFHPQAESAWSGVVNARFVLVIAEQSLHFNSWNDLTQFRRTVNGMQDCSQADTSEINSKWFPSPICFQAIPTTSLNLTDPYDGEHPPWSVNPHHDPRANMHRWSCRWTKLTKVQLNYGVNWVKATDLTIWERIW